MENANVLRRKYVARPLKLAPGIEGQITLPLAKLK